MSAWDDYTSESDFEDVDWEAEANKLSEVQKRNLYVSPLGQEAEEEEESDSEPIVEGIRFS